ncbi:MAG: diacylglycerol kinase family lipid kinase [Chitinophagaceae bacterium]|nr:diacylglycerol kinase family lipid kinase [Chitinophagaceae bacterium]
MPSHPLKLLFIINPGAGKNNTDWKKEITEYFSSSVHTIDLFELPGNCDPEEVTRKIRNVSPDRVIAVGGDGTLKLVAEAIEGKSIPIGLLPGGSANGMAKELGIPADPIAALEALMNGEVKKLHLVKVNNQSCIHLSDIGFNAFVVKKFEDEDKRGMWSYIKSAWKVLWSYSKMQVDIMVDDKYIRREAAMVVIANATKYGTGVIINPKGRLDDDMFEIVIVKRISLGEIFKMRFSHKPYNPAKTEVLQSRSLKIASKHKVHFQVDGEYMGKVNGITAEILPGALEMIIPLATKADVNRSI